MSTLLVDPLFNGVTFSQSIRVTRDVSVAHIRPWVYLEGDLQDGSFQCRVLQGATELAVSTIPAATVNTAKTEQYFHGFIRFDFDSLILHRAEGEETTEYILEFSMINHTTDPVNYIGISRDWDDPAVTVYGDVDMSGNPINDFIAPAGIQIYEYRS